ncbi:MAG TPA: hypothetical protein VH114_15750 [Candidatus Acidoferrum sp.]|jgi:hypothetical protein|nr:hypothetical protein [Candidatus Acidoferrum sp.]
MLPPTAKDNTQPWPSALVTVFAGAFLLFFATALIVRAADYKSVREVDFKDFTYPWEQATGSSTWEWIGIPEQWKVKLVNGIYRFIDPHAERVVRERSPYLSFHFVAYGDLDGSGIDEAAVALNYRTGGTANWDYLYVYKLEHGQLKLLDRLESGSRGYGGLIRATIRDKILTLDFADPERRTGDCCSDGYIRVHYRWATNGFVEEGSREHGDLKPETQF